MMSNTLNAEVTTAVTKKSMHSTFLCFFKIQITVKLSRIFWFYHGRLVSHFPVVSVGLWSIRSLIGPSFTGPAFSVDPRLQVTSNVFIRKYKNSSQGQGQGQTKVKLHVTKIQSLLFTDVPSYNNFCLVFFHLFARSSRQAEGKQRQYFLRSVPLGRQQ